MLRSSYHAVEAVGFTVLTFYRWFVLFAGRERPLFLRLTLLSSFYCACCGEYLTDAIFVNYNLFCWCKILHQSLPHYFISIWRLFSLRVCSLALPNMKTALWTSIILTWLYELYIKYSVTLYFFLIFFFFINAWRSWQKYTRDVMSHSHCLLLSHGT